jgi:preprotein translocase subunit YajC
LNECVNAAEVRPSVWFRLLCFPTDLFTFAHLFKTDAMILNSIFFLQATSGGGSLMSMLFPLLIMAVFFIFIFLPQMRRQRQHTKFISELTTGKTVYTNSGLIGSIVKVDEKEVTLLVDEKTKIRVVKSAVAGAYEK